MLQNELIAILRVLPPTNQTRATGWVLLEILGGGVPPGSPNPDAISDQINVFFHIRFQADLASKIHTAMSNIGTGGAIPVVAPKGTGGGS